MNGIFQRSALLAGKTAMERLAELRVIIFGVGGVGSWCAEGLIRAGVGHLTMVDSDVVAVSNINRQLQATTRTVGRPKVEALRERLLEINPDADIVALNCVYSEESAGDFDLDNYDYVIDAIDSLKDKIALILHAASSRAVLFSSMGAALKTDPTRIHVSEFWQVRGCPLGSMLRKRMRQRGVSPAKKVLCVYGDEVRENLGDSFDAGEDMHSGSTSKARINGSFVHITAIFGMTLCGLVVESVMSGITASGAE